ncbi:MAG: biopolymer transporter ExbD [Bacteroidetes bacterium]|nr:biopolymer transporter ExbD [Bacteroidota bacterium]MCK6609427.1 biopolymer transporter ExbD [Bacteroidia bacterium]
MNFRRKKRFEAEVSTHSLNDIMFFLLLFFLIISTVANPSVIKVLLPKANNNQTLNKKQVTLTINKSKEYYLNDKLIVPADLEGKILEETAGVPDPTIVLRMDAELTIQDLVDILSTGTKLKVRIVMATQTGK